MAPVAESRHKTAGSRKPMIVTCKNKTKRELVNMIYGPDGVKVITFIVNGYEVEVEIDIGHLQSLAAQAVRNKNRTARLGPAIAKVVKDPEVIPNLFTEADVIPLDEIPDATGLVCVLSEERVRLFQDDFRKPEHQLWKCTGGFGSRTGTLGRAFFSESVSDKEGARFNREDFIGVLTTEAIPKAEALGLTVLPEETISSLPKIP